MTQQTYVYNNIEVIKTGRVSQRILKSQKVDELIEIAPVGLPSSITHNQWVRESDLFVVQSNTQTPPLSELPLPEPPPIRILNY